MRQLRVYGWGVWGRYRTQAARDQAYAALVKKEGNTDPRWSYWEFRKKVENVEKNEEEPDCLGNFSCAQS